MSNRSAGELSGVRGWSAAWNETVQPRVQDFSPKEWEAKALGTRLGAVACDKLCVFTWRHGGHIHSILLNILQQDFGVVGTALNWFDSFLSGLKQRILVGDWRLQSELWSPPGRLYGAYFIYSLRLPPLQHYFSAPSFLLWLLEIAQWSMTRKLTF